MDEYEEGDRVVVVRVIRSLNRTVRWAGTVVKPDRVIGDGNGILVRVDDPFTSHPTWFALGEFHGTVTTVEREA
ncbi:hypothetical protein [Amycolatopsis japonica]|uniref:hypothetical protein n=1 Tax=Amycolatopsis japonica TaxID=208439 RepID=UPI0011DCBA93|nr:hypothetical protein [Amycolatopsis japonica]